MRLYPGRTLVSVAALLCIASAIAWLYAIAATRKRTREKREAYCYDAWPRYTTTTTRTYHSPATYDNYDVT